VTDDRTRATVSANFVYLHRGQRAVENSLTLFYGQTETIQKRQLTNKKMEYLIIIIAFIVIYVLSLFIWKRSVAWRLNTKISKTIKKVHYVGVVICISVFLLFTNFGIGLRGLWTTRIIIITTLIIGIFFIFVSAKNVMNKIEKWYFNFFSFLPILIAAFVMIPFLGIVATLSLYGQLSSPADKIFYEDNKLRVQSTFIGVLGPPRIDIYEKICFYEKHLKRPDFWITSDDSINVSVLYDVDSTRVILHKYLDNGDEKETAIICLDKRASGSNERTN
jgi:hypothetical protein